ncbi:CaiB/BaiF CoA transferase family protein [Variovorax sp. N23]|uniref:CaiB/BaiF CoA transferase family protein n=1 Tax=Variovorax sp. N23 TaxID=2980555 RepID=UPI0021CA5D64|nr:CoA transferase [Variovorax sp. N23]MCU4119038.1 CoA transferase [Variovorax sp. N23]
MTPLSPKPLAGLKVIDFTRVFAGPYCTMLLADLGADVVKVEIPGEGDPLRRQGPPFHHGMGITYLAANRNKRSLTLDMSQAEGKKVASSLCKKADVIVENFRPDVMGRLGIGYEAISAHNPKVIYASISGMGATGPDMNLGAFDLTIQAIGGYMSITGERHGEPIKLGTSAFDIVAGMNCYSGILAAYIQLLQSGNGQKVETSLLEGEVAFLANAGLEFLLTRNNPVKWGSEHAQQVPYKAFETADGHAVIGAAYQNIWEAFMGVLGRADLISDLRFSNLEGRITNRDELYSLIDPEVRKHRTADLLERLSAAKVPCSPVNNIDQVFAMPQVQHRGMQTAVSHPSYGTLAQIGPSTKFSAFDVSEGWTAPPLLGEHSAEVLREWLDLPSSDIDVLIEHRVI